MIRSDITGFVLAGGQSRRMGQDKARLAWADGTLLGGAIHCMQRVTERVWVVGSVKESPVPLLSDQFADCGPLAGIHAALSQTPTDWILVLAVDMPLVTSSLLAFIAQRCNPGWVAIVPSMKALETGHLSFQPLCAAYHRRLLPVVEGALSKSELSIHRLLENLQAGNMNEPSRILCVIGEEELAAAGFSSEMFLNVNTPADLERARSLARDVNV